MGATRGNEPSIDTEPANSGRLYLRGQWTLDHALAVGRMLRGDFGRVQSVDVTGVERLDSAGVLQLLRFARRQGIDYGVFAFREDHLALVAAIEDVADERPKKKRDYGFPAALARPGYAVQGQWNDIAKLGRTAWRARWWTGVSL